MRRRRTALIKDPGWYRNVLRQDRRPGGLKSLGWFVLVGFEQGWKMAPTTSPERSAEMILYVICIFNISKDGFNGISLIKTDIYFALGFVLLAASSILRYKADASAGRIDRHFKTNHRLSSECLSVLSPMDPQIHRSTV